MKMRYQVKSIPKPFFGLVDLARQVFEWAIGWLPWQDANQIVVFDHGQIVSNQQTFTFFCALAANGQ